MNYLDTNSYVHNYNVRFVDTLSTLLYSYYSYLFYIDTLERGLCTLWSISLPMRTCSYVVEHVGV